MAEFFLKPLEQGLSYLGVNYKPILAAAGAVYGVIKLRQLNEQHHSLHYSLTHEERTKPLDPTLFPQWFKSAGGLNLYVRRWLVSNPKGYVFLCHGFQEHIGRYEHTAIALNKAGYSVVGMDHQGHGQSQGDRYFVNRFSNFVEDYIAFVEREQTWIAGEFGPYGDKEQPRLHAGHQDLEPLVLPVPVFLFGHSMGGLISGFVAAHSSAHPVLAKWSGIVLSAPCMDVDESMKNPLLLMIASFLSAYLPKLNVSSLPPNAICNIPEVVQMAKQDELLKDKQCVRARLALELLNGTKQVHIDAKKVHVPLLVLHSTADKVCVFDAAKRYFDAVPSKNKRFVKFENSLHELFSDNERDVAIKETISFLDEFSKYKDTESD